MAKKVKFWDQGLGLEPVSADPSNPSQGQLQYSDGTARTEGLWVYDGSDWVQLESATTVAIRYTSDSGQTITEAGVIEFEDIDFDPNTDYNTTTGEYTVPEDGKYLIMASCLTQSVAAQSNGAVLGLAIYVDGTQITDERDIAKTTTSINHRLRVRDMLDLTAAEVVTIRCRENFTNAISLNTSTEQNYLIIIKLGE